MSGSVTIDGVPLSVNPRSIDWGYSVRIATHKTVGGKVVQLLGWSMGDLSINGHFGNNPRPKQRALLKHLASIADKQVPVLGESGGDPVRFLWPEMGWDFWVFIKSLVQDGASVAIEENVRIQNPTYTLTMFVYEDNGDIVRAAAQSAATAYLRRITEGMGWRQTEWNGPVNTEALMEALQGQTLFEYAFTHYGLLPGGTNVAMQNANAPLNQLEGPGGAGGGGAFVS